MRQIMKHPTQIKPARLLSAALITSALLGMQGCALLPAGVKDTKVATLPHWLNQRNETAPDHAKPIEFTQSKWWEAAHDPALNELIETALKDSAGIRAASAKTRAAMAQIGVLHADQLPTLGGHVDLNKQKLSKNYYVPPPYSGVSMEQGVATLNLGWNIDLWGRQAKAIEAVEGKIKAAQAEQAMVSLKLSTDIAKVYVQLRWIKAYIGQLEQMKALNQRMIQIQTTRTRLGLDDGNGLDRAKDAFAQTQLLLDIANGQQARFMAAVDSLVGDTKLVEKAVANLPASLPAPLLDYSPNQPIPLSLLARRPDLVGRRFMVQAAASEVDATRLQALPDINLNGYLGAQSIGWSKLTQPDSRVSLLGAVVNFPIFDEGKIKFATEEKKAEFDKAKAEYEGAITSAAQQVINEVILLNQYKHEVATQKQRYESLQSIAKRAAKRQQLGIDSALPVIQAELAVHAQITRIMETELRALGNQVDLVEALGGGYENKEVLADLKPVASAKQ